VRDGKGQLGYLRIAVVRLQCGKVLVGSVGATSSPAADLARHLGSALTDIKFPALVQKSVRTAAFEREAS
jgi:hypothetical protein